MLKELSKTKPQLLLMAILLAIAVCFSIYKAATVFTVKEDSPEYQRSPSSTLVPPVPETILPPDSELLNTDREGFYLPDDVIDLAARGSYEIATAVSDDRLSAATLQEFGYTGSDAADVARSLQDAYNRYRDERTLQGEPQIQIGDDSTESAATSQANFSFTATAEGVSTEQALLFTWQPNDNGRWHLSAISGLGA